MQKKLLKIIFGALRELYLRTQIVNSLYSANKALYRSQTEIAINTYNITNFDSNSFANLPSLVTLNLNENLITCLLDALKETISK
jgi:hypothetical protein